MEAVLAHTTVANDIIDLVKRQTDAVATERLIAVRQVVYVTFCLQA